MFVNGKLSVLAEREQMHAQMLSQEDFYKLPPELEALGFL